VAFDGTGSTDDVAVVEGIWSWEYGGQTATLTGPSPTFIFSLAGIYTVTLTVKDDEEQSSSAIMFVVVNDIEEPVAKAGEDRSMDQHQLVRLDARGSTDNLGIDAYEWTFEYNGTPVILSGPTHSYRFDTAGLYDVTLTVTDAVGHSDSDGLHITVLDIESPVAVSGEDLTISEGATVTMNGSSSSDNVGIVSWNWTIELDDRSVHLQGPVVTHRFMSPGRFYVSLTVTDGAGQLTSDGFYVRVEEDGQDWNYTWLAVVLGTSVIVMLVIVGVRRRGRSLEVQPLEETGSSDR
ncbi:MAG: PKD domain-containing protein, partial [Thermoplasmata archaeon]|nr:PKD domain-containing protein [Thermoplasmata archaeon]